MKIDLFELCKLEVDWKTMLSIAICVLGYAIITTTL